MKKFELTNVFLEDIDLLITRLKLYRKSVETPYIESISKASNGYNVIYYAHSELIES